MDALIDIEKKTTGLIALKNYPDLLMLFIVMLLIIITASIFVAIIKNNPNLITKWLLSKNKNKSDTENSKRQNIQKINDIEYVPCVVNKCDKYDQLSGDVTEIKKTIDKIVEHQDESWLMNLKGTFHAPYMPDEDRLLAGLIYIWWIEKNNKQNGDTKHKVVLMCYEKLSLYKMAVKQNEKLRIKEVEERINFEKRN